MYVPVWSEIRALHISHQHVPHGNDVTDGAGEDKEVEHAVHVSALVQAVEGGSRDVTHALRDDPCHCCRTHIVNQRLEGYKH